MKVGDTYGVVVTRGMLERLGGLHKDEVGTHTITVVKIEKQYEDSVRPEPDLIFVECSCGAKWDWSDEYPS